MIIYEGPSLIDGKPIVAIITGLANKSSNRKTGDMPQVWILRSDIHPMDALKSGEDHSICGDCVHRPKVLGEKAGTKASRSCYVKPMAFNNIYRVYSEGGYEKADLEVLAKQLRKRHVRIGAYGDVAALPIEIFDRLLKYCVSTGYTHQWKTCDTRFKEYVMASCDSPIDVYLATQKGYRVFYVQNGEFETRIKKVGDIKLAHCPASKEMGRRITCFDCMVCSGTRSGLKSNVTIMIH